MQRILVEIRGEDEEVLKRQALRERRPVRDHAAYLIHLKLHELEANTTTSSESIAKAS